MLRAPAEPVTVNTESDGTLTTTVLDQTYDIYSNVQIKAIPGTGYSFIRWDGAIPDLSEADKNTQVITITCNKQITAIFAPYTCIMKVNVEPVESGQLTIKPAMPTNGYIAGTKLTVNAIPYKGFKFREWTGDFSSKNRTIIITVDSDKEITANFVPETASSSSLVPLISIGIGIIVAIGVVLFLLLRRKKTPPEAT